MDKIRFISLLLTLFPILVSSCMKIEDFGDNGFVEGVNVRTTLQFSVVHAPVITRSEQSSEYEYKVNNLYVFIFKPGGEVHFRRFYTQGGSGLSVNNGTSSSTGSVVLETTTINNATIVGVANLYQKDSTGTAYDLKKSDLDAIRTLDELKSAVMKMNPASVYRGGLFMMTGYAKDGSGSNVVNITEGQQLKFKMLLERTDAKITFNIKAEPAKASWQNFNFKLRDWKICKVPAQSLLLPVPKDNDMSLTKDADGAGMTYFDTPAYTPEKLPGGGEGFIFYMPENRKGYLRRIDETDGTVTLADTTRYAKREERNKIPFVNPTRPGQTHEDGPFIYANENSTYVQFTGILSYTDSKNIPVNADVTCTVHLGHDPLDANNYQTYRNTHYTYNVTIRGIGNILVEVISGAGGNEVENRPGYDGNVVYANTRIVDLDSHYDRGLIAIPRAYIGSKMTWGVNTPYSSGVYNQEAGIVPGNLKDYKWIKFAINKDFGYKNGEDPSYDNRMVKFPGNLNYNDPDYPDCIDPADPNDFGDNRPSPSYPHYPDARLLDVNQLMARLLEEDAKPNPTIFVKDKAGYDVVYVTAFVDEYLYQRDPITGEFDQEHRTLWKESVGQEDRQLHLIAEGSSYSPDGKSSIVNSIFTFKQKAIRTIYDASDPNLKTAWGLESVMETERLDPLPSGGFSNVTTSMSNGRDNMLKWTEGKSWKDVMNTEESHKLNPGYDNAAYACMLRNRDLNGDNKIDADEVRWYLASINQLQDIFLGENALDRESRLYPLKPTGNSVYWHYTSSSLVAADNPWVLWSEEGASIGPYKQSNGLNGSKYAYRCVRNLGISLADPNAEPEDFVKMSGPDVAGKYTFDLGAMDVKSTRGYYSIDPLPTDSEHSQNSLPYTKFEVIDGAYPEPQCIRRKWNTQGWSYYQTTNPCPSGYRVPNLRELMILSSRLPAEAWRTYKDTYLLTTYTIKPMYISSTSFSMDGKSPYNNERDGFVYDSNTGNMILRNGSAEDGYVRCVRDVQ